MGIFDEPDNETYRLTRKGLVELLRAVDASDVDGQTAKLSKAAPCEAVTAYLDASFLGPFLRSHGPEPPYIHNADNLATYIRYLESEIERGSLQESPLHATYLKMFTYLTSMEANDPLVLMSNCLDFLLGKIMKFEFTALSEQASAYAKLQEIKKALSELEIRGLGHANYKVLVGHLDEQLLDRDLRNAIAHSAYRIDLKGKRIRLWNKGSFAGERNFAKIDELYDNALHYLDGFLEAVKDFAYGIHPECPYIWHTGPRY